MLSKWLIAIVGLIYASIAVDSYWRGNLAMAIVFLGYSFSNIGLWLASV